VSVRELRIDDEHRWEQLLAKREDAVVFHHPAWMKAICESHGYQPLVLGHHDAMGELDGVLPLVDRRGWVTGRRLVSLPHTPLAGPLGDAEVVYSLTQEALAYARQLGARLELKTRAGALGDACGLPGIAWSTTFVRTLPEDGASVRFGNSRNHGRISWAVRKAGREGVAVRAGTSESDLREWYGLYLVTMRTHAVPPRSFRFFTALWRNLQPRRMLRLLLAERDGRLLAGSVLLMSGTTVFYAYNGRRREDLGLRPNDLIQWHAIHDAARAGFRRYDFGEVEEHQQGLSEFKAKWGAEPETLYRHVHPPVAAMSDLRRLEHSRHWAEQVWRRIPLEATVRLGDIVYRRL
jgi:CelD/BcsL family acetyltransferase involved in cellulose biosynthesis